MILVLPHARFPARALRPLLRMADMMRHGINFLAVFALAWGCCLAPAHAQDAAPSATPPKQVIAFGDSLTAGYGVTNAESLPAVLERALNSRGLRVTVQNAGVSGDTTGGGLARLDWTLSGAKPDLFLLALGANDALRGIDPAVTRKNLETMLDRLKQKNVPVFLIGMAAPRNMGTMFSHDYDAIYPDLARKYHLPLYPFLLEGVVMNPALNQADGLHPNPKGVEVIVGHLAGPIAKLLEE